MCDESRMVEWRCRSRSRGISPSMSAQLPSKQIASLLPPPPTAVRQRLQSAFDHGQRCFEKGEYDYASDLFTQCVIDDPGNLIYLQHFLTNLAQKYGDNKQGARLAGLKIKSSRNALVKATAKGEWHEAFQAACDALKFNPWDRDTLIALSDACQQIGASDAEVFLLALVARRRRQGSGRQSPGGAGARAARPIRSGDRLLATRRASEAGRPRGVEGNLATERRADNSKRWLQRRAAPHAANRTSPNWRWPCVRAWPAAARMLSPEAVSTATSAASETPLLEQIQVQTGRGRKLPRTGEAFHVAATAPRGGADS